MKRMQVLLVGAALFASTILAVAATAVSPAIRAAVADTARPAADTERDANRKPAEMLAFAGVRPGMVVVDLLPGGGYFTRIFSRAVGEKGQVYAYFSTHNDARLKEQGRDPDNQMADLKKAYSNLGVIHGPLDKFVTPQPVDLVWTSLNYHDLHNKNVGVNVADVNKAIFASLKPGGVFVVVDHAAADNAPDDVTSSLHRIKAATVKQEVEAAGFKLVAEGHDLHFPGDDGSKRVFENDVRGKTNQFMLKFQKPRR
ncbi:MAG TPA: hypothetical protein VFQ69_03300 [Rhizomicrobium sp.]|jgi:predicted methyltransferase|nr:hypothetical protein [Rhizomicrobium sp.]